jgi:hypothetical protein
MEEEYGYSSEDASEEAGDGIYALHNAAEAGDADLLTLLVTKPPPPQEPIGVSQ